MERWQQKLAFVIQFRSETDVDAGRFDGRVEHIVSGEQTRFHSLEELLDFIGHVLRTVQDEEQEQ
jgi:hypothetical protein